MAEPIERQLLQQAHDLLAQRTTWTYGTWARDRYDDPCHWLSEHATRWSAYGALAKFAAQWTRGSGDRAALLLAMRAEHRCCAIRWTMRAVNDQLGYWAVMRLIEAGITRDAPVQIPAGQGQFVFWREESRRLQRLLVDFC